jgi:hypothetical protein
MVSFFERSARNPQPVSRLDQIAIIAHKIKKAANACSVAAFNLILAVTYVPASFPAQYHRPGKA